MSKLILVKIKEDYKGIPIHQIGEVVFRQRICKDGRGTRTIHYGEVYFNYSPKIGRIVNPKTHSDEFSDRDDLYTAAGIL